MQYLGVNLAGAEFGSVGQAYGTGYTYPTHDEIDYYASHGMNVIRVPFLWERMQDSLNGQLDQAELSRMDDVVNYATSKGLTVDLDLHNYGTYNGALVGSAAVPNSAFANLWGQLAAHYAGNSSVMFGLMNEPQQATAAGWLSSENAAIAAIRDAGATTQEVLVSGVGWDGASSWTGGTQNAAVIGTGVVDPDHNYAFEVHQYLDSDGSGTHDTVVSTSIGVSRLTAITQWAEQTGSKLFLGEFGVASDPTSLSAMSNMLTYMNQHTDAWQGATYWAGGPWWGDYMYSIEPQNGVDSAQMGVLEQAIQAVAPTASITQQVLAKDTGASATDNITSDGAVTLSGAYSGVSGTVVTILDGSATLGTASLGSAGTWTFTTTLAAGAHALQAMAIDPTGATGISATAAAITVITAAPCVAITAETRASDNQTEVFSGTVSGATGTTVALFDGTTSLGAAALDGHGDWSLSAPLAPGQYTITAVATDLAGNTASVDPPLTVPSPAVTPAVKDTLVLDLSEDAYLGDAQFTVSVDGVQVGGPQSVTALHDQAQGQDFTFTGNFGAGAHTIGVDFLNDAYGGSGDEDRNLYVNSITFNGTKTVENATQLAQGLANYVASGPAAGTAAGPQDKLVLDLSEDAYLGDAQFTVSVDGAQVGGPQSVTALHDQGQSQEFTFTGNFGSGAHQVAVNFLNDAYGGSAALDRNLYVGAITFNGAKTVENAVQLAQGIATYAVSGPAASIASTQTSSAKDTLVLNLSEDAYLGDAQFTVSVDGAQVGGPQSVTALHDQAQGQDYTFTGNFGSGNHTIGVDFLNDAYGGSGDTDRNLYVNTITFNGAKTVEDATQLAQGLVNYTAGGPAAGTAQSTLDTLVLNLSEDAYKGDAQFTVSVDGAQVGGTQSLSALHSLGQTQAFTLAGNFGAGAHTVAVNFLNDLYAGTASTDRNLYVNSIALNGARTVENASQLAQGIDSYHIAAAASVTPSTGTLAIGSGGTLILDADAAGAAVAFTGSNEVAQFTSAESFHGSITGFGQGDTMDLRSIGFATGSTTLSYTASTGVLAASDGTHTANLAMVGSYGQNAFHLASDSWGGTAITFVK